MKTTSELITSLREILNSQIPKRIELLKQLQDEIWNDESIQDDKLNEILTELAYDLDFYEPNQQWRQESKSYYGEERLSEIIISGIHKIEEYNKSLM